MNAVTKFRPQARSAARSRALQGLYQWDISGDAPEVIIAQFFEWEEMNSPEHGHNVDQEYFRELLSAVPLHVAELDALFGGFLDRRCEQLDIVERCILRLGTYELHFRPEVPWRVVVNEAVDLAKKFGADQSYKFINGILDKVARQLHENSTG